MRYRIERDILGMVKVPYYAYYGSETARAIGNFRISGLTIQQGFIRSYALLKRCAALANMRVGKLDGKRGRAIIRACDEVMRGRLNDFPLDIFQAGGGTSTNMNLNEVIANRAIELLNGKRGDYRMVHPNDHVNMSQSSNDTYPAAICMASYFAVRDSLLPSLDTLLHELRLKTREFSGIVKIGRTHMQDAVPITLGQEFSGYAGIVEEAIEGIRHAQTLLLELPIGGTAVGTGINAGRAYSKAFIGELNKASRARFYVSRRMFAVMQNRSAELSLANAVSEAAVGLGKIANDIRLLGSGPRAGLGDILIPEAQPGSSIMPGKINPSIPEMTNMVCFQCIGNATTVREAVSAAQLEINVFEPVIAYNLLFSLGILTNAAATFSRKCISGVKANTAKIREGIEMDLSIATALNPYIGYSKAAEIARKAYRENKSVKEVCIELKVMDKKKLDEILDARHTT